MSMIPSRVIFHMHMQYTFTSLFLTYLTSYRLFIRTLLHLIYPSLSDCDSQLSLRYISVPSPSVARVNIRQPVITL